MSHLTGKLTVKKIDTLKESGRYGDGGGLFLLISKGGSKSWILRTVVKGKRRDIGLGGLTTQSWRELLLDLKQRDLSRAPELAIGDGALGFLGCPA